MAGALIALFITLWRRVIPTCRRGLPLTPVIGLRYRIVLMAVGIVVVLGAPLTAGAGGARKSVKLCPSGQVRQTIKYVHDRGGQVDHATGCVAQRVFVPKSFAAIQSKVRALAMKFVPGKIAGAFRTKAARLVAATDAKTDTALDADAKAHAPPPAANQDFRARAAALTHARDDSAVTAGTGTETKYLQRYTKLDTADDTGESFVTGSVTNATHVTGARSASSSKELSVTHLINKCPDAGGVAHGTLDFRLRDLRIAGPRTIVEISTLHAKILAHFDDTAHIASVEVIGTWSFAVNTRNTTRTVGGDVTASGFQESDNGSSLDLHTTVTMGSDDAIVTGGGPLGVWVAEALAKDYIQAMLRQIPSGVCVNIVPDAPVVHVAPGGTVAIVAHLTDHHGQTFPGGITEYNPSNRVAPTKADGNPDARFTYTAPASASPGSTDVVQLSHVSKRGRGVGGQVTVTIDGRHFPQRFDGTWTRVFEFPDITETVNGTATYVRDPTFPPSLDGTTSIPYDVISGSVTWSVSGGGCSGSGTYGATENSALGTTQMTLEDVSANPAAPQPEPQPFYYSIQAAGDPLNAPTYACPGPSGGSIDVSFLDVGYPNPFGAGAPIDQIQKSGNINQLQGHATSNESGVPIDDTWSFTGSG
jgi:hypothetical protein